MSKVKHKIENISMVERVNWLKLVFTPLLFISTHVSAYTFVDSYKIRDDELIDRNKYLYQETIAGDLINPATGTVDFSVVDIDLPGNNERPVRLERWIPDQDLRSGGPTGWHWKLPMIRGTYLDQVSGRGVKTIHFYTEGWRSGQNCETGSPTTTGYADEEGATWGLHGYMSWSGVLLHIPRKRCSVYISKDGETLLAKSYYSMGSKLTTFSLGSENFDIVVKVETIGSHASYYTKDSDTILVSVSEPDYSSRRVVFIHADLLGSPCSRNRCFWRRA